MSTFASRFADRPSGKREPRRWETTLGRWAMGYGVNQIVAGLEARGHPATRKAVYKWISGDNQPRASAALAIVDMSGGSVTLDDIYRQRSEVEATRRTG